MVEAAFQHFYYLFFFLPLRGGELQRLSHAALPRCCHRLLIVVFPQHFPSQQSPGRLRAALIKSRSDSWRTTARVSHFCELPDPGVQLFETRPPPGPATLPCPPAPPPPLRVPAGSRPSFSALCSASLQSPPPPHSWAVLAACCQKKSHPFLPVLYLPSFAPELPSSQSRPFLPRSFQAA